jgi:AcrR family transcriptional regulator
LVSRLNARSSRPASRTKRDVVAQFRRDAILAAAGHVVARFGADEATVERVAVEAGLAKGTIYLYFRSKDELLDALLQRGLVELQLRTEDAVRGARAGRERLAALVTTRLGWLDAHRDLLRVHHFGVGRLGAASHARLGGEFRERYLQHLDAVGRLLDEAVDAGRMRAVDTRRMTAALFDMTRGLAISRLLDPEPPRLDDDAAGVVDLLWEGLAP